MNLLLPAIVIVVVGLLASSVRLVQQYERGIVFRFGQLLHPIRGPGLNMIIPWVDKLIKVPLRTVVMGIPAQGAITRDNVTLTVDAVVYFKVIDPVKAILNVENYPQAVSQVSQTSLRSVIGRADLDTLLSDREQINAELQAVIDGPTEEPWGLHIERVEVKDVSLPEGMKRSMSRQAEAERERRARVIAADGELQASTKLAEAGRVMGDTPGALQLRLLQTVVDVAAEKNSTLVMPFPVELLRFFDHAAAGAGEASATPPATTPAATPGEPKALPTGLPPGLPTGTATGMATGLPTGTAPGTATEAVNGHGVTKVGDLAPPHRPERGHPSTPPAPEQS